MNPIEGQLFLCFYFVAMLSGIIALVRFHTLLATKKHPLYRSYLLFLYSYSIMILFSLVTLYVEANITVPPMGNRVLQSGILISSHLLAYTLPRFLIQTLQKKLTSTEKRVLITPLWSLLPNVLFSLLTPSLLPLIASLTLFALSLIWSLCLYFTQSHSTPQNHSVKKKIYLFSLLSIASLLLETLLFYRLPTLKQYSLSMPFIYLSWNLMSISLIKHPIVSEETLGTAFALTPQESRVVELMQQAFTNKEIATHLSISPHTVKNHITSIFRKTNSSGRVELLNQLRDSD